MIQRRTIAVVDDEASVRIALERVLRACGMQVVTFASGSAYLNVLESTRPVDCLVLDLHMPRLSGFEVLDALAQSNSKVPVIVLTGHDSPDMRARVLACGAAAYLTKPIADDLLLDAITAAIETATATPTAAAAAAASPTEARTGAQE